MTISESPIAALLHVSIQVFEKLLENETVEGKEGEREGEREGRRRERGRRSGWRGRGREEERERKRKGEIKQAPKVATSSSTFTQALHSSCCFLSDILSPSRPARGRPE